MSERTFDHHHLNRYSLTRSEHPSQKNEHIVQQDWEFLKNTGFNIWGELARCAFNLQKHLKNGTSLEQALNIANQESRGNIIGFQWEYMFNLGVLVNPIKFGVDDNSNKTIVGEYGNRPLLETIDFEERLGGVREGNRKGIDYFINAPIGSWVILASPSGNSGLVNEKGQKIIHKKAQIYAWRKRGEDDLEAYTFITDSSIQQLRNLLSRYGVNKRLFNTTGSDLEQAASVVANPALITTDKAPRSFEDLAIDLRDVRRASCIGRFHFQRRKIDEECKEILRNLGRAKRGELLGVSGSCLQVISQYEVIAREFMPELAKIVEGLGLNELTSRNVDEVVEAIRQTESGKRLAKKLSETILKVYALVTDNTMVEKVLNGTLSESETRTLYARVQTLIGCNGDGLDMFGVSLGGVMSIFLGMENSFPCPRCTKPIPSGRGMKKCPHCLYTKEEHARKTGNKCD